MVISALIFSLLCAPGMPAAAVGPAMPDVGLTGTVTDQTGAAIMGAEIRLTNSATGQTVTARTDENGAYRFNEADPAAEYTMMVRRIGFIPETRTSMHIAELEAPTVSFTLAPVSVQLSEVGKTAVHKAK
jgi:hypothetical protein